MLKRGMRFLFGVIFITMIVVEVASAAHIGNTTIKRIRNFTPNYVVVWLNQSINSPPACATVMNKIVVGDMDTEWGKQKLGMLMTAMAAGYKVNPNCTSTCKSSWDGQLTICNEVSVEK